MSTPGLLSIPMINPVDRISGTSGPFVSSEVAEAAADEITRLRAILSGLRADAARYQWLRSQTVGVFDKDGVCAIGIGPGLDVLADCGIEQNERAREARTEERE